MWEDDGGGFGDHAALVVDGGAAAAGATAVNGERERERERGPAIGSLYGLPAIEAFVVREGRRSCIGSVERRGALQMPSDEAYTALCNRKGRVGNTTVTAPARTPPRCRENGLLCHFSI